MLTYVYEYKRHSKCKQGNLPERRYMVWWIIGWMISLGLIADEFDKEKLMWKVLIIISTGILWPYFIGVYLGELIDNNTINHSKNKGNI